MYYGYKMLHCLFYTTVKVVFTAHGDMLKLALNQLIWAG